MSDAAATDRSYRVLREAIEHAAAFASCTGTDHGLHPPQYAACL